MVGTPDTTRGPMQMTDAAVTERDPERAVGEISLFVGHFTFFEGGKEVGVPAEGRGVEGGTAFEALVGDSSPAGSLLATVMREVAVVEVTVESSAAGIPGAVPMGH